MSKPVPIPAERLSGLMIRDQLRLARRPDPAFLAAAEDRVQRRTAAVPQITYPEDLPVAQKKDEIADAIRDNQVVIIAGETGSGKTTQIPKICLELGLGVRGMIGHTQPRRIAARTVAERVASELGTELGAAVGWKIRFTDQVSDTTLVKLMTDGILLAELANDRNLSQYDTIIIDEAHERSLNIDFLLGYLKQLLPKRPDLKVIITSATIDPERFAAHFGDAPIVEVSGRTYPVEVRYRPPSIEDEEDQIQLILDAVDELSLEKPGDILIFLSGEREIRDTADALRKRNLRHTEILPLFARLSTAEQHKVFQPHTGRRIVLATNVAETSLTVPGIKYVIDPGTARISRFSNRLKVQRLPIEPISQASANQRKGRCGRTSDGICIRLYEEKDFEERPQFTDPEILRTNLASVILQMTALGLGNIAAFPFLDPPDKRHIADGVSLLEELGALKLGRLTDHGRKISQLPIDPRLARMVMEASNTGCVREVLIITSALSIQDPRERPVDKEAQAAQQHARFIDKESDFGSYLNLWEYLREQQKELSSSQFRKMCKSEYLHYLRVREWQDLQAQLRQVVRSLGFSINTEPAHPEHVHKALLSGLLSHIGFLDPEKREYQGARGAKFAIFPGSALFRKSPRWIMCAELVETSRLWGRVAAKIEPEWAESLAEHLVKRTYSEPHWEKKQAAVVAYERVLLYGLPIVVKRKVNYGRIDPALSRELFIRQALVEGDWDTHHKFFAENRALLEQAEELEHRARRRDIVVDDETLFAFYDQRLPLDIVSGRHFDAWWKKTSRSSPDLLTFTEDLLITKQVSLSDYPSTWDGFELTYQFEPGQHADGVTVNIPLPLLNQVSSAGFEWQVPGLREELVIALIRSLPKALRRNFVPAPDVARDVLTQISPDDGPLLPAVSRELRRLTGVVVPLDAWDFSAVPAHLRMTFRVGDVESKDLDALKDQLADKARAEVAAAADDLEQHGITTWSIGELPRVVQRQRAGHEVNAYPALVDEGDSVGVGVFDTQGEQWGAMWRGTRKLLRLTVAPPLKAVQGRLSNQAKLALSRNPYGGVAALLEDCVTAVIDKIIIDAGGPAWDGVAFDALAERARIQGALLVELLQVLEPILKSWYEIDQKLKRITNVVLVRSVSDLRSQLDGLVYPGFVAASGIRRLPDIARYLRGMQVRLSKLDANPQWDRSRLLQLDEVLEEYASYRSDVKPGSPGWDTLQQVRWMIEELRISYFAQELGTAYPVSDVRIYRALAEIA
ncbi:ATP-dependent RNA helicase HrpA [Catelliglobosispora koreensis]|uniref:ATP-dependent RNA helicase HrpA n=1 Tax=Catelliglobosispora koreensis TaxID=129052 RepID=UPI0009FBAD73|nr:ATP-dependent RNA helicase HrpA [Catelliglobosispora koreensis]